MSSRPASPPPIARWPFIAGAVILASIAGYALLTSGRPPSVPSLVVALICAGGGILLSVVPYFLDNEQRLRLAEAAVRESADSQVRRLAQAVDQLGHVMSRGQSTEEQAGQALGTLEEVAERLVGQAEELAVALSRSTEREQAAHAEELQRLTDERDQKLTALEIRLNSNSLALTETQVAIKKSSHATNRAIESLASRLDEIAEELREALRNRAPQERIFVPAPDLDTPPESDETAGVAGAASATEPESHVPDTPEPVAPEVEAVAIESLAESSAGANAPTAGPEDDNRSIETTPAVAERDASPPERTGEPPAPRTPRKPRSHHPVEPVRPSPVAASDAVPEPEPEVAVEPPPARPTAPLELALEGMPEPRPVMRLNRREPAGSTSLVATAYIGIGNKLFLRGDGPGLSWDSGVPMQFLAIGKWGWTTTEAIAPVTCRVYRNDDTPMLEENVVIDPGTKTEVTPRF